MRLYYTNITGANLAQTRPDLSLGGFRSVTVIPNDNYSNLFSDISCYSISENRDEYLAASLLNETGAIAENVTMYFVYPETRQKDIEMAFVAFNANDEIEVVPNPYSAPYTATFNAADGELNAVNIGNIPIDGQIGIWFKKILDIAAIEEEFSDANMIANGTPAQADEAISLVIFWGFAVLTTDAITVIAQTTAVGGGNITDDSGNAVIDRGVCWAETTLPTIADSLTSDGTGTGVFVSSLTGLSPNTTYFVRAYATNSEGVAYGDEVTFTTLA